MKIDPNKIEDLEDDFSVYEKFQKPVGEKDRQDTKRKKKKPRNLSDKYSFLDSAPEGYLDNDDEKD